MDPFRVVAGVNALSVQVLPEGCCRRCWDARCNYQRANLFVQSEGDEMPVNGSFERVSTLEPVVFHDAVEGGTSREKRLGEFGGPGCDSNWSLSGRWEP